MRETPPDILPDLTWALVVAGGRSARLSGKTPKQFREICGVPLYSISVRSLLSTGVDGLVLVVPPGTVDDVQNEVDTRLPYPVTVCAGGAERRDSVSRGFSRVPDRAKVVLIHDAARPFLPRSLTRAVARAAFSCGAAVAAIPAADTLKRSSDGSTIEGTVDRRHMYRAQTPQGFRRTIMARILSRSNHGASPTDESSGAEHMGVHPSLVPGSDFCFKVTVPEDLDMAEAMYRWLSERKRNDDDWSWL